MFKNRRLLAFVVIGLALVIVVNLYTFRKKSASSKRARPAAVTTTKNVTGLQPVNVDDADNAMFSLGELAVSVFSVEGAWEVRDGSVTQDPFHSVFETPEPSEPLPVEVTVSTSDVVISSVLTGGSQNVAIINNEAVTVGDSVGGQVVSEILLDRVVLGEGVNRRVIRVE